MKLGISAGGGRGSAGDGSIVSPINRYQLLLPPSGPSAMAQTMRGSVTAHISSNKKTPSALVDHESSRATLPRIEGDTELLENATRFWSDKTHSQENQIAGISNSESSTGTNVGRPSAPTSEESFNSAQPRQVPLASPRNSSVFTAYTLSAPSSWAEEVRYTMGHVGHGFSAGRESEGQS